jgi:prepilin-type N-terminal cleavage/methylation domain-containing protein
MMRGQQRTGVPAGFTIIETMIVLAVTGLLFVLIASTWAGRQRQNEFKTASNEIRSRIQQTISDVQNGYFPGNGGFSCQNSATANLQLKSPPVVTASGNQGTNEACVFLGKIVQFGNNNATADGYRTFPVAALRNPLDPSDFKSTKPTVLAPSSLNGSMMDLSTLGSMQYGLTVESIKATYNGSTQDVNAVGFISKNGSIDAQGDMESGSQQIDLYAFRGVAGTVDVKNGVSGLSDSLNTKLLNTSSYYKNVPISICFKSGGTNQYAIITLGSGSRQLQAELQIAKACG